MKKLQKWYSDTTSLLEQIEEVAYWFKRHNGDYLADRIKPAVIRAEIANVRNQLVAIWTFAGQLSRDWNELRNMLEPASFSLGGTNIPGFKSEISATEVLLAFVWRMTSWETALDELAVPDRPQRLNDEYLYWPESSALGHETISKLRFRLAQEYGWAIQNVGNSKPKGKRNVRHKSELTGIQEKMAAAIRNWHDFELETLSCTKCDAISNEELARQAGVSKGKSTFEFFAKWFSGGNREYRRLCKSGNPKALAIAIARLSREGLQFLIGFNEQLIPEYKKQPDNDD